MDLNNNEPFDTWRPQLLVRIEKMLNLHKLSLSTVITIIIGVAYGRLAQTRHKRLRNPLHHCSCFTITAYQGYGEDV